MVAYRTLARFAGSGTKPGLQPMVVFPASYADEQREVIFTHLPVSLRYLSCSMVPGLKLEDVS